MEKWKLIEKEYYVSDLGNVARKKKGELILLKGETLKKGYKRVRVYLDNKYQRILVHRLVALFFLPTPINDNMQIDHINCNTSDNRACNLRWVTSKENVKHSLELKRFVTEKKKDAYKKVWLNKSEEQKQKDIERLRTINIGRTPWNKGKKGLQKHTDEFKKRASLRMKERNATTMTTIVCIETGEIFESQAEASRIKNISQGNLNSCLKGHRKVAGGFHWKYKG